MEFFNRVFSKLNKEEERSMSPEKEANMYTLKCIYIIFLLLFFTWILNVIGIFIINEDLMNTCMLFATIGILVVSIFSKCADLSKHYAKYVLLSFVVGFTAVAGVALTYHVVLACFFPILFSVQYQSRRVVIYTYIITVLSLFVVVMCGFFFGLCDANMLFLTNNTSSSYLIKEGVYDFGYINDNPWVTLPLFFVFPRALLILGAIPVLIHVSEGIAKREVKAKYLARISEYDDMTGLYNKNKYNNMLETVYPNCKNIGCIFFDLNGLKETNDSLGHEHGDKLIKAMADSIKPFLSDKAKAYRVGGDEFVFIIHGCREEDVKNVIKLWQDEVNSKNMNRDFKLSAAVGYGFGDGANIEAVIKEADSMMYRNKIEGKKKNK